MAGKFNILCNFPLDPSGSFNWHFMKKQLPLLLVLLFAQTENSFCQQSISEFSKLFQLCRTEMDSLTKQLVYVTATADPQPKGGLNVLLKKIETELIIDFEIDKKDYDPHIIVAVIIDIDGKLNGARVIKDKTNSIGAQIINIARSFKWTPAKCFDKFVPMIYQITINYDPPDQ